MAIDLSSRRALITGSTSGIGKGIAHALASKGCSVVLTGIATDAEVVDLLKEFRSSYKGTFDFVAGNFLDPYKTEQFGKDVLALYPQGVDILVNCAGVPGRAPIEDLSLESWQNSLNVNLTAPFVLTKTFIPFMKQRRWGRIINISSQMGLIADPEKSAYCATKAGLLGLSRVTAIEAAEYGVTCNPICPGYADAPLGQSIIEKVAKTKGVSYDQAKADFLEHSIPTKRLITISEIAELATFLCSDYAASITGSPIPIDGGNMAR